MNKPTVSLCLIVKNEEDFILSCLNSVKHLVDEIIVVDTGSSDETVRLAREAGAKIFTFTWTGDFSQARNFALEQAACDWILFLDADEELDNIDVQDFQRLLAVPQVEGYFLTIKSYLGAGEEIAWDQVVRLFRNKPAYRFEGAIHEQVASSIIRSKGYEGLAEAPLIIKHFGYLDTQLSEKDKYSRNTLIIKRELENNPQDPFLLYCLALEFYLANDVLEGLACLEKALAYLKGNEGYFEDVLFNTALGYLKLGKTETLIRFVEKSLQILPNQPNLILLQGLAYLSQAKYQEAIDNFNSTLHLGGSKVLPSSRLLSFLGDTHNLSGNYSQAETNYFAALVKAPHLLYPLTQLLGLVQKKKYSLGYDKLCQFTTVEGKMEIWQKLFQNGEISLSLVVLLLTIYHLVCLNAFNQELLLLSEACNALLPQLKPLYNRPESWAYLEEAVKELAFYGKVAEKEYECSYFPLSSKLKMLLEDILFLLINEFCPLWYPSPSKQNQYPGLLQKEYDQ
jgi:glycosyltransferase involved in cell wall biosynthesis